MNIHIIYKPLQIILVAFFLVNVIPASAQVGGNASIEIIPGMAGKLTKEDLEVQPMPHWAPLFSNVGKSVVYSNFDMVMVSYATDADKAAALLPDKLKLIDIPAMPGQAAVNLVFAKYREVEGIGPYMEVIVGIPVLLEGELYIYVPAIYVSSDGGMAAGREAGGYPKKIATIELTNYGDLFLGHIARAPGVTKTADAKFYDLASIKVERGGELVSVPLAPDIKPLPFPYSMLAPMPEATGEPQPFVLKTMGLRYLPPVGSEKTGKPLQLIDTPWVVTEGSVYEGLNPSIDLSPLDEDPVAQALPVNSVLGSYIVKGSMYTNSAEWSVVFDYNE